MFQGIAQGGSEATSSALGMYAGYKIGQKADATAFKRQVWMARNAHQLEVQDLRDAGLNPILSATGGSGASFPQSSNTSSSTAMQGAEVGRKIGSSMSTLMDAQIENQHAASARERAAADEIRRRADAEYGRTIKVTARDKDGKVIKDEKGNAVSENKVLPGRIELEKQMIDLNMRKMGLDVLDAEERKRYLEKNKDWWYPAQFMLEGTSRVGDALGSFVPGGKYIQGLFGDKKKGGKK